MDADVANYLADLPEDRRRALKQLCALVRQLRPDLHQTLRGHVVTYMDDKGPVIGLTSQKQQMCLYVDPGLLRSYRRELAELHLGRNCIRFRSLEELPKDVIRAMVSEAGLVDD